MITLEQKVNLILRYIATNDEDLKSHLKEMAVSYLQEPVDIYKTLYDVIDELFKEIGLPCHLKGRDALAWAIKLVIEDETYTDEMRGFSPFCIMAEFNVRIQQTDK